MIGISALINKGEPCEDTAGTWPFMKEDALSSTSESASSQIRLSSLHNCEKECFVLMPLCDIFLTRAKRD